MGLVFLGLMLPDLRLWLSDQNQKFAAAPIWRIFMWILISVSVVQLLYLPSLPI
jgi:hypothetical protein